MVCMPDTPQTREVWRGLSDELGQEFKLVAVVVRNRADARVIERGIATHKPAALVLMNNPTVNAYRAYAATPGARRLPAVVVMTSFLDSSSLRTIGATGISYEVPLITAVTNLRKVLVGRVDRVGVVYRSPLSGFVRRESELARREQVHVVERRMSEDPNASEIKSALRDVKHEADAVWILNDDRVLTPRLIADGWLPELNAPPWRPTIVGVASLVSATTSLGTLAVLPDHAALGIQAANLVYDIADDDWNIRDGSAQLPLSTNTAVDLRQASERFELKVGALAQVDKVVR
jgi:putative ABC transport system substrate-binding protein